MLPGEDLFPIFNEILNFKKDDTFSNGLKIITIFINAPRQTTYGPAHISTLKNKNFCLCQAVF